MKKNKFKVTLNKTGESKVLAINIPEFIKGWWSYDKEGKKKYVFGEKRTSIPLEETMYFQLETRGISDGQEITFKLWEQDKNIFMVDWVDPDDHKFPEEEVVKKGTVKNNKVVIELMLQSSWESMIKDDSDNAFSLDQNLELYWEVAYGRLKKELPEDDDNYLRVSYSERTLYFKTPIPSHNLPEFLSYDGGPIFLMKFIDALPLDKLKKKGIKIAENFIDGQISKIALTKLKKGYMVDNYGKVYKGKRLVYEYKKMYTNSGEIFKNVIKGKNFAYNHGNGLVTTKGISQYDFFAQNGKRVKLLGIAKNLGHVFDIFNLVKFVMDKSDTSMPSAIFGPLAPIADLAGVLVNEQKAEMDMWLEEQVQMEIDIAKLKGLEATRKAINSWNHNTEFNWQLMKISHETANKLLQGAFKTFDEFRNHSDKSISIYDNNIEILYRKIKNTNQDEFIYIIETIFINE